MAREDYDVIVVGAGPGGTSCAALLANKGVKVLLLEKNNRAGGKGMTVSKQGFTHELWPNGGGIPQSRFEDLLHELGLESETCHPVKPFTIYYRDQSGEYRPYSPPLDQGPDPEEFSKFVGWLGLQGDDNPGEIARFNSDLISFTPQEIDALGDITGHEFLSRYQLPKSFYAFFAAQVNIMFVLPIDQLVASEAVKTFQGMMTGGGAYYSKGGYGRLFERCVDALKRDGGEASFQNRAERIIVEDGQVKGVVTDKGTFKAPIVISNAGIHPTVLKLVGEEHFDEGYAKYIKNLVPSAGLMGVRYFLDRPLVESHVCIAFSDEGYWDAERSLRAESGEVPEELLIFMTIPSNYDPDLSPPGKQCVLTSTLCPADPEMKNKQAYWDKLDETMARIWPDFPKHIEFRENYSTKDVSVLTRDQVLPGIGGECIGLGQTVGQTGRHKPSARAPIQGLFYVGCDAGGSGCGVRQAVDSAFNVSRLVLQEYFTQ